MYSNEEFGSRLRKRRRELDLTQAQLAERSKVSQNLIARYESGETTPGLDKAAALAAALGVMISELADLPDIGAPDRAAGDAA